MECTLAMPLLRLLCKLEQAEEKRAQDIGELKKQLEQLLSQECFDRWDNWYLILLFLTTVNALYNQHIPP